MFGTQLRQVLANEPPEACVLNRIGFERADNVAVVTLSNVGSRNALNLAAWLRLGSLFREMYGDQSLRSVVIKGAGAQAFAAGADIAEFTELRSNSSSAITYNGAIAAALESVQLLPVPVVAMISGLAIGGGCELAAACDVRIADSTCRMGIPIGRLGVTLGYTEARLLTQLIGPAALKYLLMSGDLIDAPQAMHLGLLQVVVEPGDLVEAVIKFVQTVVANSEVTMRAAKQVVNMCGRDLTAGDTEALMQLTSEVYEGSDLKEGVQAFESRRNPQFTMVRRGTNGCS